MPLFYPAVEASLASQVKWRLGVAGNSDDQDRDAALTRAFFTAARDSGYGFDRIFHDLYGGSARVDGYDTPAWHPFLDQFLV